MADNSVNNKRIAKNTFFLYIRMFLIFIVTFYTTRVILHSLGQDDFGLYNVVAGFVMMLGFLSSALANGTERFINYELGRNDINRVKLCFESSLVVNAVFALAVTLIFETVGLWFLNYKLNIPPDRVVAANWIFQFAILSMIAGVVKAPFNAIIIAKEKMNFYAVISIIEALLKLAIAFAIAYTHYDKLVIYGLCLFVVSLFTFIATAIYSKKLLPQIELTCHVDKEILKEVLSFSGWNILGSASGVIRSQGINIVMNLFFGVAINAARGIAYQVLGGVQQFTSNFQIAINPQIVQSYSSGDKERYLKLTYSSAKISLYLMWVIALPLFFCIEPVLDLWLGDTVPEYSALFILLILITGILDSLGSSISVPLYATGDIKKYQIVVSIIKIAVLPIAYILYKVGFPPETSMYVSILLGVLAQYARVKIWGKLVNEPAINYFKKIVIPAIAVISIGVALMFVCSLFIQCDSKLLTIAFYVILSCIINIPLIIYFALTTVEREQLIKYIRKAL